MPRSSTSSSAWRAGRPFETGARDYLEKTFAVVEAAYSSMASHRAVEIAEILQR